MLKRKKLTGFVSEIDKFMDEFDKTHPLSDSQVAEIKKYKRIIWLRDHLDTEKSNQKIWEEF